MKRPPLFGHGLRFDNAVMPETAPFFYFIPGEKAGLNHLDCLFIENVGNLVCPASDDLGEDVRFVLLSVTEGADKPLKYPATFNSADVAVITKSDLAAAAEFDEAAARRNIHAVRPGMDVLTTSAKTGEGIAQYLDFLERRRVGSRTAAAV